MKTALPILLWACLLALLFAWYDGREDHLGPSAQLPSIEVTFEGERWEYATVQIDAPPIGSDEWQRLGQYGVELPTGVTFAYDLTGDRPAVVHVYTLEIDVPGQRSRHATRSFEIPRVK